MKISQITPLRNLNFKKKMLVQRRNLNLCAPFYKSDGLMLYWKENFRFFDANWAEKKSRNHRQNVNFSFCKSLNRFILNAERSSTHSGCLFLWVCVLACCYGRRSIVYVIMLLLTDLSRQQNSWAQATARRGGMYVAVSDWRKIRTLRSVSLGLA